MAPRANWKGFLRLLDLAKHIVEQKSGHFEPDKFKDHYETALQELLSKKQNGLPIAAPAKSAPSNVVNLMDALRQSIGGGSKSSSKAKRARAAKKATKPRRKAS